jgi:membrane-bound lytic murein transglycosylase B
MTAGLWMRRAGAAGLATGLGLVAFAQTPPEELRPLREPVEQFVTYMVQTHGFDRRELHALFSKIQPTQSVARAIAAPSTAKPWHEFRPLFVDERRISGGVQFWNDNAETLARARETFGVPEGIIVSLIGIETRYGRITGGHKVAEALSMLAFDLDNRPAFFRSELEQFLLLAREQRWEPLGVNGSFAGAMGLPQFMPSSYRSYAVDFDGDGQIDLWRSLPDAIGSVANYLRLFGWKSGEPVVTPARIESVDPQPLIDLGLRPSLTLDQWRMRGVEDMSGHKPGLNAALFQLDLVGGPEFWLGFDNFYALLQYNRSRNYVMAVHDLAQEIKRERERIAASAQ